VQRCFEPSSRYLRSKRVRTTDDKRDSNSERNLRCRACGNVVARDDDRIGMLGMHEHTCTNPHGIHFHIGCFREAPGGAEVGASNGAHTWFAGYYWRIMLCAQCGAHLGWGFHARVGDRFFGLILDRLSLLN
jgi:hypothetical protein